MIDEVRELYRAYFMNLTIKQFNDTITVYWSKTSMPGYSMNFRTTNHKTSISINKYAGTIKFASSTSPGRDLW